MASANLASQMLSHATPPYSFNFTPFLQATYQHGLPADRPICKAHASTGHCPNGTRCTERHVSSSSTAQSTGGGGGGGGFNSLVCKHWLRGLCKKGESCEFLHEYNLRKMPECNFFVRNGYCSNGDECLYLHIDPRSKLPPCPHYERGFCELGPRCSKRHVRRKLCPYYLAGFCPDGRTCKEGAHPRWDRDLEKPSARVDGPALSAAGAEEPLKEDSRGRDDDDGSINNSYSREGGRERGEREGRDRSHDRPGGGHKDKFGGGDRRGRWRGRGGHKFRGRNH